MKKTAIALALALGLAACGTEEPTLTIEGEEVPLQEVIDDMEEQSDIIEENGFEVLPGCWIKDGENGSEFRDAESRTACEAQGLGIYEEDGVFYQAYSGWVGENGLLWDGEQYVQE